MAKTREIKVDEWMHLARIAGLRDADELKKFQDWFNGYSIGRVKKNPDTGAHEMSFEYISFAREAATVFAQGGELPKYDSLRTSIQDKLDAESPIGSPGSLDGIVNGTVPSHGPHNDMLYPISDILSDVNSTNIYTENTHDTNSGECGSGYDYSSFLSDIGAIRGSFESSGKTIVNKAAKQEIEIKVKELVRRVGSGEDRAVVASEIFPGIVFEAYAEEKTGPEPKTDAASPADESVNAFNITDEEKGAAEAKDSLPNHQKGEDIPNHADMDSTDTPPMGIPIPLDNETRETRRMVKSEKRDSKPQKPHDPWADSKLFNPEEIQSELGSYDIVPEADKTADSGPEPAAPEHGHDNPVSASPDSIPEPLSPESVPAADGPVSASDSLEDAVQALAEFERGVFNDSEKAYNVSDELYQKALARFGIEKDDSYSNKKKGLCSPLFRRLKGKGKVDAETWTQFKMFMHDISSASDTSDLSLEKYAREACEKYDRLGEIAVECGLIAGTDSKDFHSRRREAEIASAYVIALKDGSKGKGYKEITAKKMYKELFAAKVKKENEERKRASKPEIPLPDHKWLEEKAIYMLIERTSVSLGTPEKKEGESGEKSAKSEHVIPETSIDAFVDESFRAYFREKFPQESDARESFAAAGAVPEHKGIPSARAYTSLSHPHNSSRRIGGIEDAVKEIAETYLAPEDIPSGPKGEGPKERVWFNISEKKAREIAEKYFRDASGNKNEIDLDLMLKQFNVGSKSMDYGLVNKKLRGEELIKNICNAVGLKSSSYKIRAHIQNIYGRLNEVTVISISKLAQVAYNSFIRSSLSPIDEELEEMLKGSEHIGIGPAKRAKDFGASRTGIVSRIYRGLAGLGSIIFGRKQIKYDSSGRQKPGEPTPESGRSRIDEARQRLIEAGKAKEAEEKPASYSSSPAETFAAETAPAEYSPAGAPAPLDAPASKTNSDKYSSFPLPLDLPEGCVVTMGNLFAELASGYISYDSSGAEVPAKPEDVRAVFEGAGVLPRIKASYNSKGDIVIGFDTAANDMIYRQVISRGSE